MRIKLFEIFRYRLPLISPLFFRKEKIAAREGLILKLAFDHASYGFGEIAVLPGLSSAGIDRCLENLREACLFLTGKCLFSGLPALEKDFFTQLDKIPLYPAVRFGVEMALLNALANQSSLPLSKFLSADAVDKVMLNGLILESGDSLERQVERLLEKGYKLIKVKVSGDVREDIKRLIAVLDAVRGRAQVHVDANRKWSFAEAILFSDKLAGYNIKYIEEPFSDTSKIPDFFRKTAMPVALDESLLSDGFDLKNPYAGVEFLVFKPTLLGGIRKTASIMRDARVRGIKAIVSSAFESGLGLLTFAHLAASGGEDVSAGLDTLQYFTKDLLKEPPVVCGGKMILPGRNILEGDIRAEYLNKIL